MEQKQPPKVFCKKRWPATLLRKRLCYRCFPKQPPEVFCKKRWPATLFKKRLWHRCFPVNFAEFLRTSFLQNTSGRLVLMEISCRGWYLVGKLSIDILSLRKVYLRSSETCEKCETFITYIEAIMNSRPFTSIAFIL